MTMDNLGEYMRIQTALKNCASLDKFFRAVYMSIRLVSSQP